jgi:hypothetical protein
VISDDTIDQYLGAVFGTSEPGAELHHLLIAAAPAGATSALGGVPELGVHMHAIAPVGDSSFDANRYVLQCLTAAFIEHRTNGRRVHFAALAMEQMAVLSDGTEATENQARLLAGEHRLREHPAAVEVTVLYAACSDGRRWIGEHILTGPRAGRITGPTPRFGRLGPGESGLHHQIIRIGVGAEPTPAPNSRPAGRPR